MLYIQPAVNGDYPAVKGFYDALTDEMEHAPFQPGWKKDIYPTRDFLLRSIAQGELYTGLLGEEMAACMVVNRQCNDGYRQVRWSVEAGPEEVRVIHALGVRAAYSNRGFAKEMVQEAVALARKGRCKTIRLDILAGNLPAERAYTRVGFRPVATLPMFYEDTGWTDYKLFEFLF